MKRKVKVTREEVEKALIYLKAVVDSTAMDPYPGLGCLKMVEDYIGGLEK